MKKIVYILVFVFGISNASFAQDDAGKLRDKMIEYIQQRLGMSKDEAEKFQPIFLDYLKQLRTTKQEFQGDQILLKQKIAELRVRTRDQLKPVIGEKRSNEVFIKETEFIQKVKEELNDRRENRIESRSNKKSGLLQ